MAERLSLVDTLRFRPRRPDLDTVGTAGHWDGTGRAADEWIAECATSPHYLESSAREV